MCSANVYYVYIYSWENMFCESKWIITGATNHIGLHTASITRTVYYRYTRKNNTSIPPFVTHSSTKKHIPFSIRRLTSVIYSFQTYCKSVFTLQM